jgi:penicillin-binding protein-related factor A (putative recombinase)
MQNGKRFEKELDHTFDSLMRSEGVAFLARMSEPTAPSPRLGKFGRVLSGTAPYDFYGMMKGGKHIAMEAKHNDKRKASLPIIGYKKKGSGLQFHQLEALANVALHGGIARVVWCNGGVVMSIGNREILMVHKIYNTKDGRKSIPTNLFVVCEQRVFTGVPYISWLNAEDDV